MSATVGAVLDRRATVERRSRASFHLPERRTGFDRRVGAAARRPPLLETYRTSPAAIAIVLMAIVFMNVADLMLTAAALRAGATELNPLMANLFMADPVMAVIFKLATAIAVAGTMWALRRYRRVLQASLAVLGLFTVVLAYSAAGLLLT